VCGYPSDLGGGYRQFWHSGTLQANHKSGKGVYDVDTRKGISGSPVYYIDEGACFVVGLHKGNDLRRRESVCTLLTREVLENLQRWMGEMSLSLRVKGELPLPPILPVPPKEPMPPKEPKGGDKPAPIVPVPPIAPIKKTYTKITESELINLTKETNIGQLNLSNGC
jgi:hypothetical protein